MGVGGLGWVGGVPSSQPLLFLSFVSIFFFFYFKKENFVFYYYNFQSLLFLSFELMFCFLSQFSVTVVPFFCVGIFFFLVTVSSLSLFFCLSACLYLPIRPEAYSLWLTGR